MIRCAWCSREAESVSLVSASTALAYCCLDDACWNAGVSLRRASARLLRRYASKGTRPSGEWGAEIMGLIDEPDTYPDPITWEP